MSKQTFHYQYPALEPLSHWLPLVVGDSSCDPVDDEGPEGPCVSFDSVG